jgi:hypothetical protein
MRFRRAFDRGNVTEALSAASELPFIGLAEAARAHASPGRQRAREVRAGGGSVASSFRAGVPHVEVRESLGVLALLAAIPANRLAAAAPRRAPQPAAIVRANRPGSCALVASSVELVVVDSRLERQARNESLVREMNERIERLDRAAQAGLEGEHLVFEFLCECGAGERGDAGCEEQIEMTVAEYEEVRQQDDRFALLPGHETEELEAVLRRTERYVIVDKKPEAESFVEDDPRGASSK